MSAAAHATVSKPQYDAARAAYLRTVRLNEYVKQYVNSMTRWPAQRFVRPDYTDAQEFMGAKCAARMMHQEEQG